MTLQTMIQEFLTEQRFRRNSSETIEYYEVSLRKFAAFAGSELEHSELTLELYKTYTLHLLYDCTELSSYSVQSYMRAVKAFYNYFINEELLPDFSRKLRLIKADKKIIIPLSDDEIEKLLSLFDTQTFLGLRNKCIVVLMLDSGLRLGEVVRLQIGDIDFERNFVRVTGKGSKQRLVPLGRMCKSWLSQYRDTYRLHSSASAPLFVSTYRESALTRNAVHCFFDDLKKQLDIPRLYPHLLRHTFATLYIFDGGDLETLRCILGHSTIAITQIYVHLATNYKLAYRAHQSHLDNMKKPHSEE